MLKQAELGLPVADPIRQVGISEQTVYRWKKEYAGLGAAGSRVEAVGRKHAALEAGRRLSLGKAVLPYVLAKNSPRPALMKDVVGVTPPIRPILFAKDWGT